MTADGPKRVAVAAAVIERPDGAFLLAQRPPGTAYAGYWEFPGGKLEAGESPAQALVRELREELGVEATEFCPWITREFLYPHAHVRLHFFRVTGWTGALQPLHHTAMAWQRIGAVDVAPVLPANGPVFAALALPTAYAITDTARFGIEGQLARLQALCARGPALVQIRENALEPSARRTFIHAVLQHAHQHVGQVLVNAATVEDQAAAVAAGADGIHLPARVLMGLAARPDVKLVGASCHNADELAHAAKIGLDFVLLGPVLATPSHPGEPGMGWTAFSSLVAGYPLPVFSLGGVSPAMLATARDAGAHGVAGISAFWPEVG